MMDVLRVCTELIIQILYIVPIQRLTRCIQRRIYIYDLLGPCMAKATRRDPKSEALAQDGVLNRHPDAVRDALFSGNPFFDPKDLVQVRYEMVRRHQVDGAAISEVASAFGVSRPTFYKAQGALEMAGLTGLLPGQRGPKGGHKISAEVIAYVAELKAENPELTTPQCLDAIEEHFGVKAHRRSLERALARKKKRINPP
jgi:transposase